MRSVVVALAVLGGCTVERTETSIWNLHTLGAMCPKPAEAEPVLVEIWGSGTHGIDGMHCSLDEIIAIEADDETPDDPSCCYQAQCQGELDSASEAWLCKATCLGARCSVLDLGSWTRADAADALAAAQLPHCVLDPDPAPVDTTTLQCWYAVTARYQCSTEGG